MMHYKPCGACPLKKECALRDFIRNEVTIMNELEGVRLSSMNFSCEWRQALFIPGERVEVTLTEWEEGLRYSYDEPPEPYPKEGQTKTISATVMRWINGKVQIWLDEPIRFHERENVRVKIKPNRLKKINEPAIAVCPLCGKPENQKNEEWWNCEQCDNFWTTHKLDPGDEIPF